MPLYSTHLLVGLLCSLPFYNLDRKDRLRTIIAGMFAGVLPDIDGVLQFIPHSEFADALFIHRGFWHWWGLWLIFVILGFIYILYLARQNGYRPLDNLLTFGAISLAWLSHLILDFGFTKYWHTPAVILEINWDLWLAADQFASLVLSALLAYLIYKRSFHEDTLV